MLVTHVQPKRFPDLEALGATRCLLAKALRRPFAEMITMRRPCRPIDAAKDPEAVGRRGLEQIEVAMQDRLAPAAIEIDQHTNMGRIHRRQQLGDRPPIPAAAKLGPEMIVGVDHKKARMLDWRRFRNQCRARAIIGQQDYTPSYYSRSNSVTKNHDQSEYITRLQFRQIV